MIKKYTKVVLITLVLLALPTKPMADYWDDRIELIKKSNMSESEKKYKIKMIRKYQMKND